MLPEYFSFAVWFGEYQVRYVPIGKLATQTRCGIIHLYESEGDPHPPRYSFTVVYEPADEGGYVVTCPAPPAVVTQGETLEDARTMAADAIHLVLQSLVDNEVPILADKPSQPTREPIREILTVSVQGAWVADCRSVIGNDGGAAR